MQSEIALIAKLAITTSAAATKQPIYCYTKVNENKCATIPYCVWRWEGDGSSKTGRCSLKTWQ